MTNKEIMQASLLDIIFENRNKEYGAYALRLDYDKRLFKALGIGMTIALLFVLMNSLKFDRRSTENTRKEKEGVTLTTLELPKEPEPELQRPVERPVAQINYTPPLIVPEEQVDNKMVDQDDLKDPAISTQTVIGDPDNKPRTNDVSANGDNKGTDAKAAEPQPVHIKIVERAPQYPGGLEALAEFMRRNLVTPEEIEVGVKKVVRVRFIVGVDGSITDISILESPGKIYDKEVTRVLRKMPRWEPAIQNDINVAISYVLPVTFIAEEY